MTSLSRLPLLAILVALAAAPAWGAPQAAAPRASARAYSAYLRGRLAEQQSDWRAALDSYRAAVLADPVAPALRVALAEARARTGDLPGAEAEARKAIELDPAGPAAAEAWLILGKTATISRRPADAERALRSAVETQAALAANLPPGQAPVDPDPWRLLAQARLDAGDGPGAEAVATRRAKKLVASASCHGEYDAGLRKKVGRRKPALEHNSPATP